MSDPKQSVSDIPKPNLNPTSDQKPPLQQLQNNDQVVEPAPATNNEDVNKDVPVVVSEADVESVSDSSERLMTQIENLTGEIQALESKIDRLTGNATNTSATPAPSEQSQLQTPVPPVLNQDISVAKVQETLQVPQPTVETPVPPVPTPQVIPTTPVPTPGAKGSAINDIYNRLDNQHQQEKTKTGETARNENLGDLTSDQPSAGGAEKISEILAVIGIILFLAMIGSGFLRTQIGEFYTTIQDIGWLASLGVIGIGFIISLFVKGRGSLKVLMVLFLLLAAAMYLGLSTEYVQFLEPFLGPFFELYR